MTTPSTHGLRISLRRTGLLALALLTLGLCLAGRSARADGDSVRVPLVEGSLIATARQTLEAQGLSVVVVDVAGPQAGRVARQEPLANTLVPVGTEVMLRVGIALRVETRVPELRGQRLPDVGPELEQAYVLEVELVGGPPEQDGRILEQMPAPGQPLLFRGVLALRVVQGLRPEALGVIVPAVLGRPEAQALDLLRALGLAAAIEYVEDPAHAAGTVLSQAPASGTEMLSGGSVSLRVAGAGPQQPLPAPGVPAPNLVGLGMNAALEAAQSLGFVPQLQFQMVGGQAPWTCVQQTPVPGTALAPGSAIVLVVALPSQQPAQVTVPTLFGLSQAQAAQLLAQLGLSALTQPAPSGFPAGMVFAQDPQAGAVVPKGAAVRVFVAVGGPGNPGVVKVPNVVGLSAAQAFLALKQAGLSPKGKTHLAPGAPVDVVDAQQPPAQASVPAGSEVRYYVPAASIVPALIGRTRGESVQALHDAGFNPKPQGPAFGIGPTVVIAQGAPAGVPLARGSEVAFAFKFQGGGGIPVKVQVPQLLGLPQDQAVQALQQKGLGVDLDHQGPVLPGQGTKVVNQAPPANTLVNPGTVVKVVYVEVLGGGGANLVLVPDLSGMTQQAAQQALQQAQLQGQFTQQGPLFPGGTSKVISQQPVGGAAVPPGTLVQVTYVRQPVLQIKVAVPDLVNLTVAEAEQALAAKNLQGQFSQQGPVLLGTKVVVAQQVPAGTLVNPGTTVQAAFVYKLVPQPLPQLVLVPKVTGMTRAQAEQALAAANLTAKFQGANGNPNKLKVVTQNPAQGKLVAKGSQVTMFVIFAP